MRKTLISLIAIAITVPLVAVFAQKNPPVSKTFTVGADCKIVLAGDKAGALSGLNIGDKIRIAYHDNGTNSVADRIHLITEADGGGKAGTPPAGGKKANEDMHVHGTITAVDKTAGTVTVEMHQKPAAK